MFYVSGPVGVAIGVEPEWSAHFDAVRESTKDVSEDAFDSIPMSITWCM